MENYYEILEILNSKVKPDKIVVTTKIILHIIYYILIIKVRYG